MGNDGYGLLKILGFILRMELAQPSDALRRQNQINSCIHFKKGKHPKSGSGLEMGHVNVLVDNQVEWMLLPVAPRR